MRAPSVTPVARRYGGLTAVERDRARRQRLLAAGLDLFGTQGYARTTVQAVCTRARVTARNFYDHFHGLEDLLRAVYEMVVARGREALLAGLAAPARSAGGRLRAAAGAYLHALLDDPRAARVQCVEVVGVSPGLEARRRAVIHEYVDLLAPELRRLPRFARLDEAEREVIALVVVGGMDALLIEHVAGERYARPIADVLPALAALLGMDRRRRAAGRGRAAPGRQKGARRCSRT